MEFTQEFITENGLSEEQVAAVTGHFTSDVIPTLKKEYDGVANTNAEGILTGASNYAKEKLGFDLDRDKGEKVGDYLKRALDSKFSSTQSALDLKQTEINEKLANFKGGDEYKLQLDGMKSEKDLLLQKLAKLEPLEGLDEKYQGATTELSKLKTEVAYGGVKPNFPNEVNKFEAKAQWDAFKSGVEAKYTIELVDGKPIAVDKENIHKTFDLQELVSQDKNISELLKGRQQGGTGAKQVNFRELEGIPFKIPENATSEDLSSIVREHVLKEISDITNPEYSKRFGELYQKVKLAQKK
tara:strand:- start:3425 stop:4318 length:894 start_codon:yes stop_codon:yes gene_type:complete